MTGSAGRWPLGGAWRAWYRVSWVICAVALAAGLALVMAAVVAAAGLLVPAAIVLLVGGVIGWQLLSTARVVELDTDGGLRMDRLRGPVRTHAARVRRVRRSVIVSGRRTPVVIETDDGTATLVHTRQDVEELVQSLRDHNPTLRVDL